MSVYDPKYKIQEISASRDAGISIYFHGLHLPTPAPRKEDWAGNQQLIMSAAAIKRFPDDLCGDLNT